VNDFPGRMSTNALSGAILAAWKSTECGIGELLVSVTRAVCPCLAWITGPGTPPLNVHASYLIPGAIESTRWEMPRFTFTTGPGVVAGSSAGSALCAVASASAFAGAIAAKLGVAWAPSVVAGIAIPGMDESAAAGLAVAAVAAARFASLRASCAEAPSQTAATARTPTPRPRNNTRSLRRTPDSSSLWP
jgi:hypothetical protein